MYEYLYYETYMPSAFLLLFHFSFGQLEGAIKFAKSINQDDQKDSDYLLSDEFEEEIQVLKVKEKRLNI